MSPRAVEGVDVAGENSPEMTLARENQVIRARPANRANDTFGGMNLNFAGATGIDCFMLKMPAYIEWIRQEKLVATGCTAHAA